jgi:SPP1 gp7 family putative phage head morphogenesis protein
MPLAVELQAEPLTPEEAVALLEAAGVVDAETYYAESAEYRRVAFTLSRVHNAATMAKIKRELVRQLESGGTLRDFMVWLEEESITWTRWYSEVVFRNATQGAYSRARWMQMSQSHIRRAFPALLYDAIMDARTSEICEQLDGRWWWREDFPASLNPPNHHQCRSVVRPLRRERTQGRAGQTTGAPGGVWPDEGWDGNPATDWAMMMERRAKVLEAYVEG